MTLEQNTQHTDAIVRWRDASPEQRKIFRNWVEVNLQERERLGMMRYHNDPDNPQNYDMKGDPLEHLVEELFDALFYAFYARKERSEMQKRTPALHSSDWLGL